MQRTDDMGKYFDALAIAVASGQKIKDAAEQCGCSESHAYHTSSTRQFRLRVTELRQEATALAVGKLTTAASHACDTLVDLLAKSNDGTTRLNAAKAILTQLGPMSELLELRQRIRSIELGRTA